MYLSSEIAGLGPFELLSDGRDIPVFAFRLKRSRGWTVYDLSDKLRERGWLVPAYTMPPDVEDISVLRIVCREGLSRDLAANLLDDVERSMKALGRRTSAARKKKKGSALKC